MKYAAGAVCAVLLAGCVQQQKPAPFEAVQSTVNERIGKRVEWYTGGDADEAVRAAIEQTLSRDFSADEAVQIALLNNRNLQATFENLGIAQADLVTAGLIRNPVLDGDILFSTAGGGTAVELTVLQNFLDILWIPMRKSVAEAALDATQQSVAAAAITLAGDVRSAYFELLAAQDVLELRRTVVEATGASFELARRIHAAGNITDLELHLERASFEQSKLDLSAAELLVTQKRERLNRGMGLWGAQTQWKLTSRLPELPDDQPDEGSLEALAVARSLALARYRHEITQLGRQLGVTEATVLLGDSEFGAKGERDGDGDWGVGPAFSVPLPLFDQGQGRIAAARARLRQARHEYFAAATDLRSDVRAASARLNLARDRARYLKLVILPLRSLLVNESQKQFNAMTVNAFQLLQARQAQIEAGAEFVEALREYWLARTSLELLLAGGGESAATAVDVAASRKSADLPDRGGH